MKPKRMIVTTAIMLALSPVLPAQQSVDKIPVEDFERLHSTIKPQTGESPWRDVAWVTNITEARRRGAAEDKPLVIFTAADGSPLGRT